MTGAEIVIACLEREGVDMVFAYPGATSMRLHQALLDSNIRVVLPRHEQGGAFAADGYARVSGKPGVCIATSGPGATNLVTAIADAWNDSVPLVAITAQVNQHLIGKNAFQETDIIGVTRPVVKHSYLVLTAEELPDVIKDALNLAVSGRPGPIVIDIPNDVLRQECEPVFPEQADLRACCFTPEIDDASIAKLYSALRGSSKPCIYAGGGIIHSGACAELLTFAENWKIPVATSLMGKGAFPETNELSLQMLGLFGTYAANQTIKECDLLIAIGARFIDRVTCDMQKFAPNATIAHIDIDDSEINKNKHADIAVIGDAKDVLARLNAKTVRKHSGRREWLSSIAQWKTRNAKQPAQRGKLNGPGAIAMLNQLAGNDVTLVTGVGQHQIWTAQNYVFSHPRQLLTSGGLGAMGFGLPAAIGVKLASPESNVILVDGDGSFQMNIQELATLFAEKVPVKMIVLDNQKLGMVAAWEDKLFNGRHANTDLAQPNMRFYPDFVAIAQGYGIPGKHVFTFSEYATAIKEMLASTGPFLVVAHI